MRLLEASGVETSGADAVVVGRSMIVGKPMALLLMARGSDATVTVAHSRTKDLAEVCRRADIIIAAVGIPEFIKKDFVKKGATIVDVGINRVGEKLVGDVAFDEAMEVANLINARYIIPIHTAASGNYSQSNMDKFTLDNKIALKPGDETILNHD